MTDGRHINREEGSGQDLARRRDNSQATRDPFSHKQSTIRRKSHGCWVPQAIREQSDLEIWWKRLARGHSREEGHQNQQDGRRDGRGSHGDNGKAR